MADLIQRAFEIGFKPKDRQPTYHWAANGKIQLPPVISKSGPFDVSGSRHFIGPFDALDNDRVREVNVLKPVRGGGTLLADVWLARVMSTDPGPARFTAQTDPLAKEHAETRSIPILKSCGDVCDLLPTDRHKDRGKSIIFNNGIPLYFGGPSLNNLQNKPFRYFVADEPWLYKAGTLEEMKGRMGDFLKMEMSKMLFISQGGETEDDWDNQCQSGELDEWHIRCHDCGHYMPGEWQAKRPDGSRWGIVYDEHKDKGGLYIPSKMIPTLRFECEKCTHVHLDTAALKSFWNLTGQYQVIGDSNEKIKTFHWTALIDYPWANLLEQWLDARNVFKKTGIITKTIIFWQKRMAKSKNIENATDEVLGLKTAAYEISTSGPTAGAIRLMSADRQEEDVYWVEIRDWTKLDSKQIWFGNCYSPEGIAAKQKEFSVASNCVCVDSAYLPKGDHGVYMMCLKYGWWAIRGEPDFFFWHSVKIRGRTFRVQRSYSQVVGGDPGSGTIGANRLFARLVLISSPSMNDTLQGLIDKQKWIQHESAITQEMRKEYERQISAEKKRKRPNKKTGREEWEWYTVNKNNHGRDLGKMQCFLATIAKVLPDPYDEQPPEPGPPPARETATPETK